MQSVRPPSARSRQLLAMSTSEDAHAAGGRVNVETQCGSNGLHGQGFLFDRQNTWGARNPFTQWVQEPLRPPRPLSRYLRARPSPLPITRSPGASASAATSAATSSSGLPPSTACSATIRGLSTVKWPENFFAQPTNDQMQLLGAQLGHKH